MEFRLASAAFIAVFATYLFLGGIGVTDRGNPHPRDAAFNLLARGLLSGHLYIDKEVPPVLEQLKDPYDPSANRAVRDDPRYRLHDFSYYRGKLYLYFGVPPALFLFVPWHLVTGGWLAHWAAVVFLCSAGLLVNLSLVNAVRIRITPGGPPWLMAICTLILGLGSYAPLLVARADMWEIPIAFSYLSISVALRCLWEAFGNPGRSAKWIAFASAAVGAAFAARPTALPNAAILLIPFFSRETRRSAWAWVASAAPLALCGAGVGLYNALRFGDPFDFGMSYQMAGVYVARLHAFSPQVRLDESRLLSFSGGPVVVGLPVHPRAPVGSPARAPAAEPRGRGAYLGRAPQRPDPLGRRRRAGLRLAQASGAEDPPFRRFGGMGRIELPRHAVLLLWRMLEVPVRVRAGAGAPRGGGRHRDRGRRDRTVSRDRAVRVDTRAGHILGVSGALRNRALRHGPQLFRHRLPGVRRRLRCPARA